MAGDRDMWATSKKLTALIFSCTMIACSERAKIESGDLPGYNLSRPQVIQLKSELDEISGIVYYPKDTSVFAINDENGILYKIYLRDKLIIHRWKFSSPSDYEDLALVDSAFYVLRSKGHIYTFTIPAKDSVISNEYPVELKGKNNFESLYYDDEAKVLVSICKECATDKKTQVTAFAFNPANKTFSDDPFFVLDSKSVDKLLGLNKEKFMPSAAAIHPVTKELYILSSVNKAIVVTERNGKPKYAVTLDPRVFKQPEGITFSPEGHLFISNESADVGPANILIFKYKSND